MSIITIDDLRRWQPGEPLEGDVAGLPERVRSWKRGQALSFMNAGLIVAPPDWYKIPRWGRGNSYIAKRALMTGKPLPESPLPEFTFANLRSHALVCEAEVLLQRAERHRPRYKYSEELRARYLLALRVLMALTGSSSPKLLRKLL